MPGNHRCPDCKLVYLCTADECDEHYQLQCTPCEHMEYDITRLTQVQAQYLLNKIRKQELLTRHYYEGQRDANPLLERVLTDFVRHSNSILRLMVKKA